MFRTCLFASFIAWQFCGAIARAQAPDEIKERLDKAKATYKRDMEAFKQAVIEDFNKRDAKIRNDPEDIAYQAAWAKYLQASKEYLNKREEIASKDGDRKSLEQIKVERSVFNERGELPKSAPMALKQMLMDVEMMAQAGKKRQGLLDKIKAESESFATIGALPESLPFDLEKMRLTVRAKLEVAYDLAVREYTAAKKNAQATAIEEELKEFKSNNGVSVLAMPGFQGRFGAIKEKLLRSGGGNDETEAAVGRALAWLAKQQHNDGYWEFDGTRKEHRVAATGMCLLPFLAAGETHLSGKKYRDTVKRGVSYLKAQIKDNGQFGEAEMTSQALATIALCEASGMTRDSSLKAVASKAVDFIIQAQAANGSWGHTSGTEGDTTIVGWQIQALKSAKLAQIPVPSKCWEKASAFLESVSGDSGATYGDRAKDSDRSATAPALLCRQFMGWTPRNPSLLRGVEFLWTRYPPKEDSWDIDYYYYATQVVHFVDGPVWHRDWNPLMRAILLKKQITEKSVNARLEEFGSWPKDARLAGDRWGKLGTSALACLTLEVYYRNLPLYRRAEAEFGLPK